MQPNEKMKLAGVLKGVYDFYRTDLSEFAIDLWWRALQRFDFGTVQNAFDRHLMNPDTGQFLPKPADIIRMLSGRTQDTAQAAWSKVDEALRKVGTYQSVVFDDPLIHRVLYDMGGWIPLGMKTEEEWPFVANEFRTRYQGYRIVGKMPEYPPKLVGIAEQQNRLNGYEFETIALIGDETKAKLVHAKGSSRQLLPMTQIGESALLASEQQRCIEKKDAA